MRMFSLAAILISVLLIGWFMAGYLRTATSAIVTPPDGSGVRQTPIEAAQGLASMDRERTKMMESLIP